jgi:phospholipid/cholesterol/gamma-HCH transport system substrate-binding protein
MISASTRRQLVAFAIVTAVALSIMSVSYLRIPAALGFGQYDVEVDLAATGDLYSRAGVTYRGRDVGVVRSMELHGEGVRARLSIDDAVEIPRDSVVEVRSASAVGELYVAFVPTGERGPSLRDGDIVPVSQTRLPTPTGAVVDGVDTLLDSLPRKALATTVDEAYSAFVGHGEDLGRLLDSAEDFQDAADANLPQTTALLSDLRTVLATQQRLAPEVGTTARDLGLLTDTLVAQDKTLRALLRDGSPAAREITGLTRDLQGTLPHLLTDLASTAQVLNVYLPGLKHTLTVFPGIIEGGLAAYPPARRHDDYPEGNLSFRTNLNDPPVCTTGFPDAAHHRDPADVSPAPLPPDSYCKVPHDDPRAVRGARNNPCPQDPTRRAATAAGCGLVFQPEVVAGRRLSSGAGTATYDPRTGRLLAPNGEFYLVDQLAADAPSSQTWQDFLVRMVTG